MAQKIIQGQTIYGTINLRKTDPTTSAQDPYPIPNGAVIEIAFPGIPASDGTVVSVQLSTANSGEITIVDAAASQISFVCPPTKSALINPGVAAVDVYVTATDNNVDIFEEQKVYNVVAPQNPQAS